MHTCSFVNEETCSCLLNEVKNVHAQCGINIHAVILRIKIITTDIGTLMNENIVN